VDRDNLAVVLCNLSHKLIILQGWDGIAKSVRMSVSNPDRRIFLQVTTSLISFQLKTDFLHLTLKTK